MIRPPRGSVYATSEVISQEDYFCSSTAATEWCLAAVRLLPSRELHPHIKEFCGLLSKETCGGLSGAEYSKDLL